MRIGVAVGAYAGVVVAAITIAVFVGRSMGYVAFYTSHYLHMLGMAIDAGGYVLVMFAAVCREVVVDILMAGSTHLFCQGVFENSVFDRKMRVTVASEADAPVPLRIF